MMDAARCFRGIEAVTPRPVQSPIGPSHSLAEISKSLDIEINPAAGPRAGASLGPSFGPSFRTFAVGAPGGSEPGRYT